MLLAQGKESSSDTVSSTSRLAQPATELPNAPAPQRPAPSTGPKKPPYGQGGYSGPLGLHLACGGGLDFLRGRSQGALALCGAGFTLIPFSAIEFGGIRLQGGSAHFYLSEDAFVPLTPVIKRLHGEPIGIFGYTKIVGNSNRLDYGMGWEHHLGPSQSVGLEVRDYLQFSNPVQHAVVFRLALVGGGDAAD